MCRGTGGTGSSSQAGSASASRCPSRGTKVAGRDEDESADVNLDDNGNDEIGCETRS